VSTFKAKNSPINDVINSLKKIVEERNSIMNSVMLMGKHRTVLDKDRVRLLELKSEVRRLA
jgi:hypothetical protein